MFRKLSTVLSVPHQELIIQLQEGGQLPHPGSAGQRGHDAQKEELRLRAPLTRVKMRPTGFAVAGRSGTLQFLGSSFPTSHAMSPQPQALFEVSGSWQPWQSLCTTLLDVHGTAAQVRGGFSGPISRWA